MSELSQVSPEAAAPSPASTPEAAPRPVQRRADARLSGDFAAQERALSPAAAVQRKGGPASDSVHAAAEHGISGAAPAYPGTVSGFISTAEALKSPDIIAGDKAKVLDLLALQAKRYPSPKMLLGSMGAAGAGAMRGATATAPKPARLGKPSMFYLLAFKENVYVADNREHGVTAGNEPELQTTNMPAQAFLMGNLMVKA